MAFFICETSDAVFIFRSQKPEPEATGSDTPKVNRENRLQQLLTFDFYFAHKISLWKSTAKGFLIFDVKQHFLLSERKLSDTNGDLLWMQ